MAGGLGEPPGLGSTYRPLKKQSKNPFRQSLVMELPQQSTLIAKNRNFLSRSYGVDREKRKDVMKT